MNIEKVVFAVFIPTLHTTFYEWLLVIEKILCWLECCHKLKRICREYHCEAQHIGSSIYSFRAYVQSNIIDGDFVYVKKTSTS